MDNLKPIVEEVGENVSRIRMVHHSDEKEDNLKVGTLLEYTDKRGPENIFTHSKVLMFEFERGEKPKDNSKVNWVKN